MSLNAEGDTSIREEFAEGLGNTPPKFLTILFGAIIKIAATPQGRSFPPTRPSPPSTASENTTTNPAETDNTMSKINQAHFVESAFGANRNPRLPFSRANQQWADEGPFSDDVAPTKNSLLTQILPDSGYFLAGGLAGVFSRTATAPLDRLKVYLIANVGNARDSVAAAKRGDATEAAKKVGRPLVLACKELWKAGGVRSLFAGKSHHSKCKVPKSLKPSPTGNGLNVLKVMPESAIKFGSYEAAKRALAQIEGHGDPQKINPYSKFAAGGFGGIVSQ